MKKINYFVILIFIATTFTYGAYSSEGILSLSDDSIDFDEVVVGEEETYEVEVTNDGSSDVKVANVSLWGDFFEFDYYEDCEGILESGDSCSIEVLFAPGEAEDYQAELIIESEKGQYLTVDIYGEGIFEED